LIDSKLSNLGVFPIGGAFHLIPRLVVRAGLPTALLARADELIE